MLEAVLQYQANFRGEMLPVERAVQDRR